MSLPAFLTDETAAVAVDWVALSATVIGLGLGTAAAVRLGALSLGEDINTTLGGASVAALGGGAGNPLLAGVGTAGCDWYCIFTAFWEWNEGGPFDPDEFGHTLEWHADQRIAEFESYATEFLHDVLAGYAGVTPENTPEPLYSTYMAERQIVLNIIAQRGG